MADVVTLPTRSGKSLVSVLTELLARAQSGDVVSMAAVFFTRDEAVEMLVTPTDSVYATLGALEVLKADMLDLATNG